MKNSVSVLGPHLFCVNIILFVFIGFCLVSARTQKHKFVGRYNFQLTACLGRYRIGEKWKDGCNLCKCMTGGLVACSRRYCNKPLGKNGGACYGKFKHREKWYDGCNTCYCSRYGIPICTRRRCKRESDIKSCSDLSSSDYDSFYFGGDMYPSSIYDCPRCECEIGGEMCYAECLELVDDEAEEASDHEDHDDKEKCNDSCNQESEKDADSTTPNPDSTTDYKAINPPN